MAARGGAQVSFCGRAALAVEEDGAEERFGPLEDLRGFAGVDLSFADWLAGADDAGVGPGGR